MWKILFLLPLLAVCTGQGLGARETYDSISRMLSGSNYSTIWWEERAACLASLDPGVEVALDNAWQGMLHYWETRGTESDLWYQCDYNGTVFLEPCPEDGWFECNCTYQQPSGIAIWEPCNYASNLAYDRLMVEVCLQQGWAFPRETVAKIAEAFAIVTAASSFFHGSQTQLGGDMDRKSNDLFVFIVYQAGVSNIPYDPVIHDLSNAPRNISGEGAVDAFLDMYLNKPVTEWSAATNGIDIPKLQKTFCGVLGYVFTLVFDPETVDQLVPSLMETFGVTPEDQVFVMDAFLPAIRIASSHHYLGLTDRLELLTNTLFTVAKLLYAFVWQEDVIDFGGANLTPEANSAGAALLPYLNEYANNQTSWELHVDDAQRGESYPGWQTCNPVIPHAKWHAQTAASLADVGRLMDSVYRLMQQ